MSTCAQPRCPAARRRRARAAGRRAATEDLPLPDGPTIAEQRRADEPRDELRDEPLAAEEVLGVGDVEGRQALERAHDRASSSASAGAARSRAAWSSTTSPASSASIERSSRAAGRGLAPGDRADPARRLAPRPLAGDLVDAPRDAAAGLAAASRPATAPACAGA